MDRLHPITRGLRFMIVTTAAIYLPLMVFAGLGVGRGIFITSGEVIVFTALFFYGN